jgi:hypothetical protein
VPATRVRGCDSRILFIVLLLVVYGFLFMSIEKRETAETTQSWFSPGQ